MTAALACCARHGLATHARRAARNDPTRTGRVRRSFEAEAVRRFRWLRSQIYQAVVTDDGFGLTANARRMFDFPRSEEKVESFMAWLKRQEREGILTVTEGTPVSTAGRLAWTSKYVQHAYTVGVQNGAQEIRRGGVDVTDRWVDSAFARPIHADRIGLLYTRTYSDLEGITQSMDRRISRVLADGIAAGDHPRLLASRMTDVVDKIGIVRVRTLARTETIAAHHQAQINAYREAGVEGVTVLAEWSTAGDDRVCPECEALQGKVYSLDQIEGMIPVHPNCRCTALPKVIHARGVILD
jgi:SPP1 gp7 family putative phage head morphogenesis protein